MVPAQVRLLARLRSLDTDADSGRPSNLSLSLSHLIFLSPFIGAGVTTPPSGSNFSTSQRGSIETRREGASCSMQQQGSESLAIGWQHSGKAAAWSAMRAWKTHVVD